VRAIGHRPKVVNDKDVKAIYYRETPQIIFATNADDTKDTGYVRFNPVGYGSLYS